MDKNNLKFLESKEDADIFINETLTSAPFSDIGKGGIRKSKDDEDSEENEND